MSDKKFSFALCMNKFIQYLNRSCYSWETSKGYEKDLGFFKRFIESRIKKEIIEIQEIKKEDLLDFMDYGKEKGHKINTIARRISSIKSFYKFLVYELDYPVDVAARIKVPKAYIPLPPMLTESKVKLILDKAAKISKQYQLLFSVLYYTGSRLTPVRTLNVKHVSLIDKVIYFPKVKGGKDLYLPIHNDLGGLFESYFESELDKDTEYVFPSKKIAGQALSASDIRKKLKMAASMAGIETRVTPHLLRHCTATHLTIKNVEQRKIANILGHSDLRSTMRYQHLTVDHLRDSINSL